MLILGDLTYQVTSNVSYLCVTDTVSDKLQVMHKTLANFCFIPSLFKCCSTSNTLTEIVLVGKAISLHAHKTTRRGLKHFKRCLKVLP